MFTLTSRLTGTVIFESDYDSLKDTLADAVSKDVAIDFVDLRNADLSFARLDSARLSNADLTGADLDNAMLGAADLRFAILKSVKLTNANVSNAKLDGVDLSETEVRGSCFGGVDFSGFGDVSFLDRVHDRPSIVPESGEFIGYKKGKNGHVITLRVLADARRNSGLGRVCRADAAEVLAIDGDADEASSYDPSFVYGVGQIVRAKTWEPNRWVEAHGIHFFLTQTEAENYGRIFMP